jgi:hypothetical protein
VLLIETFGGCGDKLTKCHASLVKHVEKPNSQDVLRSTRYCTSSEGEEEELCGEPQSAWRLKALPSIRNGK